jgi:hypothetical protein
LFEPKFCQQFVISFQIRFKRFLKHLLLNYMLFENKNIFYWEYPLLTPKIDCIIKILWLSMTPLELSEWRSQVTLQVVASPFIIILTILEMSSIVLGNIYSTGITHDDHHLQLPYFYSTGHRFVQIDQMELFEVSVFGIFPRQVKKMTREHWLKGKKGWPPHL